MKTKKVVVGVMTAALFSLSLGALPVSYAATETVQISVGSATVDPGAEFTVDVTLADIPSAGIQGCDFSIEYDSSLITVTSVTAGALTETGVSSSDPTASMVPNFESYIMNDDGCVNLVWSTVLEDSAYWLQGEGVFCTITGTVSADAAAGSETDLKVVSTGRVSNPDTGAVNSQITAGYTSGSEVVKYEVATTDGKVTVASAASSSGSDATLYGDADLDGSVTINDAVKVMSYVTNKEQYPLEPQGLINADVYQCGDGLSNMDALAIQKKAAQLITDLPESHLES
ncbi:MAG: Cohesin domain protein [Ruminococcus sp.]|nr:Cohesin domain protein [Ruminococcus sp.]